jgi:hypothetical protein
MLKKPTSAPKPGRYSFPLQCRPFFQPQLDQKNKVSEMKRKITYFAFLAETYIETNSESTITTNVGVEHLGD